jgi:DNA-binding IclR family transcriptional regulator
MLFVSLIVCSKLSLWAYALSHVTVMQIVILIALTRAPFLDQRNPMERLRPCREQVTAKPAVALAISVADLVISEMLYSHCAGSYIEPTLSQKDCLVNYLVSNCFCKSLQKGPLMSSAAKALTLLSHFSTDHPEIGLSQLCRLAGRDKATTYRHLQALETAGFIEKNPATKQYRLGPAVLQLAQVREATVPRRDGAKAAIATLADTIGETAHVTVLSGHTLYGLCACESPNHSIRAVIDLNIFPLHATASGLCALAFGPAELFEIAAQSLEGFTAKTPTNTRALATIVDDIRTTGFGRAERSYEDEIQGFAAPVFDHTGHFAGAVAVACVASRLTPDLERRIKSELILAAREITRNWGGTIPAQIAAIWTQNMTSSDALEHAS